VRGLRGAALAWHLATVMMSLSTSCLASCGPALGPAIVMAN